ncbi:unnamed protein product, partial [marine sediment metagenome]
MSARDRIIIGAALAVIACVIGYWLLLGPSTRRLKTANDAIVGLEDKWRDVDRVRRISWTKTAHDAGMWTAAESSLFPQKLAELAESFGARIIEVSVANPRRVDKRPLSGTEGTTDYGLFEMKVMARFQGVYAAMRRLLAALYEYRPPLALMQVTLAGVEGEGDEIRAATEIQFFVFQEAAGSKPVGPMPVGRGPSEPVAVADAGAAPFGPLPRAEEEPPEAGDTAAAASLTVPPDLPTLLPEEPPEELPEGPWAVLVGIVGREGSLLAAISVEDRTTLYAAGDKLSEDATVTAVHGDGIQMTVARRDTERRILVRTGQPLTGVVIATQPEPWSEVGPALPLAAGTVTGPGGAVGLIREQER